MVSTISTSKSPLTAWLSTLEPGQLTLVLAARPDVVAEPVPCSLEELAERLQRPASVSLALHRLPLPCLQAAEALTALGTHAGADELAALLGTTEQELDNVLGTLAGHALVWPDKQARLHMTAPLRQIWPAPLGLGPRLELLVATTTSEELRLPLRALGIQDPRTRAERLAALLRHHRDQAQVRAAVTAAPLQTKDLLELYAGAGAGRAGTSRASLSAARGLHAQWALDRALLVRARYGHEPPQMPAEVAIALRGPGWQAPFTPVVPAPELVAVSGPDVQRETAAAATAFAGQAASVLAECADRPPTQLKSGGIGAREIARLAKVTCTGEQPVRLVLEIAHTAGLLSPAGDQLLATEAYDAWSEQEPAGQLAALLHAWWRHVGTPSQSRDRDGKLFPALNSPPCSGCLHARHSLLGAASGLPEGHGVRHTPDLGPLLEWHQPLADQLPQDDTAFATLIREAELLGVLARGCISPLGAALHADDPQALLEAATTLLPRASTSALIGADLTAVATGVPSTQLSTMLNTLADRETSGTASIWRFTPASIRRALDAGHTAETIRADLTAIAAAPLPQPVTYLISDTARTHGRIRLATAATVLHSNEPALLTEIAAHRSLIPLGLRKIAPTVLVSSTPLSKTLAALRAAGYAPVAENDDGTTRVERFAPQRAQPASTRHRLPASRRPSSATSPTAELDALASRLLTAPAAPQPARLPAPGRAVVRTEDTSTTEDVIASYTQRLSSADIRQLAHAVDQDRPITIQYTAASGRHTTRTLSDLDLDPPHLYAWCHLRNDGRCFTLSRIHSITSG